MFNELTAKLPGPERDALAAEFYRRNYLRDDEAGSLAVGRDDNHELALAGDRTVDALARKRIGGATDYYEEQTAIKVIAGDAELTPAQIQEARDLRRMVGHDVNTPDDLQHVDKLRYVFMTERGARKNLAFIEAMLDGDREHVIELEVIDGAGKRYRITRRDQLANKELQWLSGRRAERGFAADELRVSRELLDGDIADAARAQQPTGAAYDPRYRLELNATDYDLSAQAERQAFAADVIDRARKHAATLGRGQRQSVIVDLRGQALDAPTVQRLRLRIVDGSGGAIHSDDLVFVEGAIDEGRDAARYQQLRRRAVDAGADPAATDRAIAVFQERGLSGTLVGAWHDNPLRIFGNPEVAAQLELVQGLARQGRIRNLSAWLEFTAEKADPAQRAAELREAHRRATEDPSVVVDLGGDANAPVIAGQQAPSFDGTVAAGGTVVASFEVTVAEDPVGSGADLEAGMLHAVKKIEKRGADQFAGRKEATIQIDLMTRWSQGRAGVIEIAPNGDRVRVTRNGLRQPMKNVFDEFEQVLNRSDRNAALDRVVIVDRSGVKAVYVRGPGGWKRNP